MSVASEQQIEPGRAMAEAGDTLLEVKDLRVVLPLLEGNLVAADGVSFAIRQGRTLGLVGESGCGKTITAQSILKIAPRRAHTSGEILLHYPGRPPTDIVALDAKDDELLRVRGGECAMIFQEPMTSFSPVHTIGNQLIEAIRLHRTPDKREAREVAIAMLQRVGIPAPAEALKKYPHYLSGGMRQRAMIAMALSSQPRLLIADEPTTALDVTVQAQVLRLMRELQRDLGMAILYISHDLGVIARMADDVAVMYMGSIVEHAAVRDLFRAPRHPYTLGLMASVPRHRQEVGRAAAIDPRQCADPDQQAQSLRLLSALSRGHAGAVRPGRAAAGRGGGGPEGRLLQISRGGSRRRRRRRQPCPLNRCSGSKGSRSTIHRERPAAPCHRACEGSGRRLVRAQARRGAGAGGRIRVRQDPRLGAASCGPSILRAGLPASRPRRASTSISPVRARARCAAFVRI
jgi:peptide/nickel transport system ATP-binding protein